MAERTKALTFPSGGLSRKFAYQSQAPFTTPSCQNVWLVDPTTGRERGGQRPPLGTSIGTIGAPYNYCEASYLSGGTLRRGIAVTTENGTYIIYYASGSWTLTEMITIAPGTTFSSCAVYLQGLYQARSGGTTLYVSLPAGAGAGAALGSLLTAGIAAPTNCGIVATHGDRLYLCGASDFPWTVYSPRIGTPTDWDYTQTDESAAVAFTVKEPITSFISHTRDCAVIGQTDSMHLLIGNIAAGGQLMPLKAPVGPLMQSAHCHIGNGTLMFMTRQGLFAMAEGCGSEPVIVSQNQLPNDLKGIDPGAGDWCSLGYCSRWDAVDIIVNKASGTDLYYRYFLSDGGSFWPMAFSGKVMQLAANIKYKSSATVSPLLLMTDAGLVYQYDTAGSETIDSYLVYGPIALGGPSSKAEITEICGTLAEGSGAATASIFVGDSPQEAFAALSGTASYTCANWAAGFNGTENPRVNGTAAYVRLDDVSGAAWSPEEVVLTINGDGNRKKG
jgi:hypothetical protein